LTSDSKLKNVGTSLLAELEKLLGKKQLHVGMGNIF
jgi:hypothetical protein